MIRFFFKYAVVGLTFLLYMSNFPRRVLSRLEIPRQKGHEVSALQNPDLEPTAREQRTWGIISYSGFWGVSNTSITTWSAGVFNKFKIKFSLHNGSCGGDKHTSLCIHFIEFFSRNKISRWIRRKSERNIRDLRLRMGFVSSFILCID